MYYLSSWLIAVILLGLLLIAIEAGHRIAGILAPRYSESARLHVGSMRASMLTILALLLGFTFSQSLQRYEDRSEALVDEANAIGTAYLRAQLIAPPAGERARSVMHEYVGIRVQMAGKPLSDPELGSLREKVQQTQSELWRTTQQVAAERADPITALFVQSVNELIDSYGRRESEISRHVPENVLAVVFLTFVLTVFVVGLSCGLEGDRPSMTSYLAIFVVSLSLFIIIDLDHPRQGLVKVSHQSLIDLQAMIETDAVSQVD